MQLLTFLGIYSGINEMKYTKKKCLSLRRPSDMTGFVETSVRISCLRFKSQ